LLSCARKHGFLQGIPESSNSIIFLKYPPELSILAIIGVKTGSSNYQSLGSVRVLMKKHALIGSPMPSTLLTSCAKKFSDGSSLMASVSATSIILAFKFKSRCLIVAAKL